MSWEAQNSTGGDRPALSLPNELASAEALRQRVKEALARVENEEGRRYENLTDKDAGLLTSKGGFIAGYNAQAVEVTPSSDDHPQLIPMIEASAQNAGVSEVEDSPWRGVVTLSDARIPFRS